MKDNTIVVKLSGKALGGVEELSNLFKSCKDQRLAGRMSEGSMNPVPENSHLKYDYIYAMVSNV